MLDEDGKITIIGLSPITGKETNEQVDLPADFNNEDVNHDFKDIEVRNVVCCGVLRCTVAWRTVAWRGVVRRGVDSFRSNRSTTPIAMRPSRRPTSHHPLLPGHCGRRAEPGRYCGSPTCARHRVASRLGNSFTHVFAPRVLSTSHMARPSEVRCYILIDGS